MKPAGFATFGSNPMSEYVAAPQAALMLLSLSCAADEPV
jgi:hypothetical protein